MFCFATVTSLINVAFIFYYDLFQLGISLYLSVFFTEPNTFTVI